MDFVETVDDVPHRVILDTTVNDQGTSLVNFLLQTNMCLINGRICPLNNGFTSVSHRGKAIVDYFITTHGNLDNGTDFGVRNLFDLFTDFELLHLYANKVSDHNPLYCTINLSMMISE